MMHWRFTYFFSLCVCKTCVCVLCACVPTFFLNVLNSDCVEKLLIFIRFLNFNFLNGLGHSLKMDLIKIS